MVSKFLFHQRQVYNPGPLDPPPVTTDSDDGILDADSPDDTEHPGPAYLLRQQMWILRAWDSEERKIILHPDATELKASIRGLSAKIRNGESIVLSEPGVVPIVETTKVIDLSKIPKIEHLQLLVGHDEELQSDLYSEWMLERQNIKLLGDGFAFPEECTLEQKDIDDYTRHLMRISDEFLPELISLRTGMKEQPPMEAMVHKAILEYRNSQDETEARMKLLVDTRAFLVNVVLELLTPFDRYLYANPKITIAARKKIKDLLVPFFDNHM